MLIVIPYPQAWFTKKFSALVCKTLGARAIPLREWVTIRNLYSVPLPANFDLASFIQADRIDAINFTSEDENEILIHPDKLFKISQRTLRRQISRSLIH